MQVAIYALIAVVVILCLIFLVITAIYMHNMNSLRRELREDEQKHAQEKKRLREFFLLAVGAIGHDLNNALHPIIAVLSMPAGASDDTWGRMEQQADNLQVVLRRLVEGSRAMFSATRDVQFKNLRHVIREVFARMQLNFDEEVEIVFEDRIGRAVHVDYGRLLFVIRNILSNSFKYAHPERVLQFHVELEQRKGLIRIVVRDNGLGIPEDQIARVMRGFHRVHKDRAMGVGWGWYMISELVTQMEGRVELRSQEGKWTEVILELPQI